MEKGIPLYSEDIDIENGVVLTEEKGAIPTLHFYQYQLSGCLDPSEVDQDGTILPSVDIDLLDKQITRKEVYSNDVSTATSDEIKDQLAFFGIEKKYKLKWTYERHPIKK